MCLREIGCSARGTTLSPASSASLTGRLYGSGGAHRRRGEKRSAGADGWRETRPGRGGRGEGVWSASVVAVVVSVMVVLVVTPVRGAVTVPTAVGSAGAVTAIAPAGIGSADVG